MISINDSIEAVIKEAIKSEVSSSIKAALNQNKMNMSDECLIDIKTVCEWTGMSATFIKDPKNKVPHYRFGDAWRFKPSEIRQYIEDSKGVEIKLPQIKVIKSKRVIAGGRI